MSCELCNQVGGTLIWQSKDCRVVLIDDADYPGFCRVIWNHHSKEMSDLTPSHQQYFMATVFVVEAALREVIQPDKINLASLGNMTPHLHWHVIPRYKHDKHFPQPIWAIPQRVGQSLLPPGWQARLIKNIHDRLSAVLPVTDQ